MSARGEVFVSPSPAFFIATERIVARMKPSGHAFGVPKDKLSVIRGIAMRMRPPRISRSLSLGTPKA